MMFRVFHGVYFIEYVTSFNTLKKTMTFIENQKDSEYWTFEKVDEKFGAFKNEMSSIFKALEEKGFVEISNKVDYYTVTIIERNRETEKMIEKLNNNDFIETVKNGVYKFKDKSTLIVK